MTSPLRLSVSCLVLLAAPAFAHLPYNPTRIFLADNGSSAYIFSSQSSTGQIDLYTLNTSDSIDSSSPSLSTLTANLPFSSPSSERAFTPILSAGDLHVLAGDCDDSSKTELWHYAPGQDQAGGKWDKLSLSTADGTAVSRFLPAAFSFSPAASARDTSFYIFGGMCPGSTSTAEGQWTSNASYSNDMVRISPDPAESPTSPDSAYRAETLASRGPPVAEAGLSITPLVPTYPKSSSANDSRQQNFVVIGGHTQGAFINMSQIALFSLPEESWAFEAVQPTDGDRTDLLARSNTAEVEPRSGHTAVLTPDGSKIIVFGGWVGDTSTPAEPQLAILELGHGYGGMGDWKWSIPSITTSPFHPGQGIYGHGAAMLDGGVMLVSGGFPISADPPKLRRKNEQSADPQILLFNVTSASFIHTYTNPSSLRLSGDLEKNLGGGALRTASQKAGLGVGLVLGFSAVAGCLAVWIFYSRRLRQKRSIREKELRELALGPDRFYASALGGGGGTGGVDGRGGYFPETRSASWGSRQEKAISTPNDDFPWAPVATAGQSRHIEHGGYGNGEREAERSGLLVEIPSPTRGLRRSALGRGTASYIPSGSIGPSPTTGEIHTITEQDEESEAGGSLRRPKSSKSRSGNPRPWSESSDPFKDPPPQLSRSQSEADRLRRESEIQGWVEDWEAAGSAMESGRPYPGSSSKHDQSNGHSSHSRTGSPDKSDRTNSNLSEMSTMSSSSIQRSVLGTISRNVSLRSASAGYTLFANAAAALTGRATLIDHPGPGAGAGAGAVDGGTGGVARASSKRSASLNLHSDASARYKAGSQGDRSDTFSTAHTSFEQGQPLESDALLSRGGSTRQGPVQEDVYETPPESPVRGRNVAEVGSGPGRRALGWMGSVKRALTGTDMAGGVRRRIEGYEQRNAKASMNTDRPAMSEKSDHRDSPRRAASASASFWRGKKGARDWDAEPVSPATATAGPSSSSGFGGTIVRRKPVGPGGGGGGQPETALSADEAETDEWDVEAAVQRRLVQVMFTVPKEKLRVVNADQLSLVSKSDVDPGEVDGEAKAGADEPTKRVSTVLEEHESPVRDDDRGRGGIEWKGKEKQPEQT